MRISILTPTADRPIALEQCEKYVVRACSRAQAQGIKTEWIVADGSQEPQVRSLGIRRVAWNQFYQPRPAHNLCDNLLTGLPACSGDIIVIMEDDDWYSDDYLLQIVKLFEESKSPLVGFGFSEYYHVPTARYRCLQNDKHASLCNTAFKRELIGNMMKISRSMFSRNKAFVDMHFWRQFGRGHVSSETKYSLGIKGLPGRQGIGIGHRPAAAGSKGWVQDTNLERLAARVGDDFDFYREFIEA